MPMRNLLNCILLLFSLSAYTQAPSGIITGTVSDVGKKNLEGVTIQLIPYSTVQTTKSTISSSEGAFELNAIPFGYYKLQFSYTGLQTLTLDSIYFRAERYDFNLDEIVMAPKSSSENMNEVKIYAEKPLVQNVDGNIIFNAGESALSAGSNASDLLASVPLVTKDGDGKILVKGKEPKILIDDKPVEMNLQQLQDLLESMPGSAIEKIEILTNPPPQYAMEEGGVINIVTKKGRLGQTGRLSINAGSRGEKGTNGNYIYRKRRLAINFNAGISQNNFKGYGYSKRENLYKDSTNFFNNTSEFENKNLRPAFKLNLDYDINKQQSFNVVVNFNQNTFRNKSSNEYQNLNRNHQLVKRSQRFINSDGDNENWSANISYTLRTKKPGEVLRINGGLNLSQNDNNRYFYQQFLQPDSNVVLSDSTQQQLNFNYSKNYNVRVNYDLPLKAKSTFLSLGTFHQLSISNILVDASFKRKSDGAQVPQTGLSNHFQYEQTMSNYKGAIKQIFNPTFSVTAGMAAEGTQFQFDLYKTDSFAKNVYWSFLPFANINKKWNDALSLTASYRRTIRRPGINELNPTRDESDPYNIRFGNPDLKPSMAHIFDLVFGKTKTGFYANMGFGYNVVQDIFSQLRDRISDNTTVITWQNISNRQEYEVSSWNGYTISKTTRINVSANYRYNVYGRYEKEKRSFRDGGSFTSNVNAAFKWNDLYNSTASFTYNQFANPQGTSRSNVSMNLGTQAKFFDKRMTLTANIIDPFTQQENRRFTYGNNFRLENFNTTNSRNYRLTVSYQLGGATNNKKKADPKKDQLLNKLKQNEKA